MSSKLFGSRKGQKTHLTVGRGGLSGEVADLRDDIEEAFKQQENQGGYLRTDEFTNPAVADVDAIKVAAASAASIQSFVAANFGGVIGAAEIIPPRNITITTSSNANIDAVTVALTGRVRDRTGALVAITDTILLTDAGGVTDAGDMPFSFVDTLTIPAQGGTGGTVAVGTGIVIGLSDKVMSRAGLIKAIREIVAGAVVTTGSFLNITGSPVSTYTPSAAPDATKDYAVTYEVDPT